LPIKYYPEDQQDSGWLGIKFPMNGTSNGSNGGFFNMSRTTEEQAITNYVNLLLTRKGERYHQPNFGVFLQGFIFENNTLSVRTMIKKEIENQCAYWLPYIRNHSIEVLERAKPGVVNGDPENAIQIVIKFSVQESLANKTITIFEEQGRIRTIVE
jgi:phage baseplate assembly protein W